MANNTETPAKKPSLLEATLLREDFIQTVATNLMKVNPNDYGTKGMDAANSTYQTLMNSEGMNEYKGNLNNKKQAEYTALGVAGEPSQISNADLSYEIIKQIDEVMSMSKLGELYDVVKKVAPGLDFKIDDKIKNMTANDLIQIAHNKKAITEKGFDLSKLSKEEQVGFTMYQTLSSAYKEMSALNLMSGSLYQKYNEQCKAISDELAPKPENPEGQETSQ